MKDWKTVEFGTLYKIPSRNGLMRPKRVRGAGYKMVNMGEIFAYDRINNPEMELVPMNEKEIRKYKLKTGDLLFARQSMVEAGAGKCSIILDVPEITTFESHIIRVRLNQKLAHPLFYYYYFNSPMGKGSIKSIVTGAVQKGVRGSDLQKLEVHRPDLEVQEEIAEILGSYDDLIANNERRIALLEEAMHLLYREWFVHLRFPGWEETAVVDGVPEGWEKRPLGDKSITVLITRGYQPKYNEESTCRVINQRCIRYHKIDFELTRGNDEYKRPITRAERFVRFGDVLVNSTGIGTLGRVAQVYQELEKHTVDSHVTIVRPNDTIDIDFFGLSMLNLEREIEHLGEGATGQTELSRHRLAKLDFLIPEKNIQANFSEFVHPMRKQITTLLSQNQLLKDARDSLLPRLMSGRIEV